MNLLLGIGLLGTAFLAHLLWWRIALPRHHTNVLLIIFTAWPFIALCILSILQPDWVPHTLASWIRLALFYVPFSLVYIGCYSMLELKSPAISMVEQIDAAGQHGLPIAELKAGYAGDTMLSIRLAQMQASFMIEDMGDAYRLLPKGHRIGLFFMLGAWLLGVEEGG